MFHIFLHFNDHQLLPRTLSLAMVGEDYSWAWERIQVSRTWMFLCVYQQIKCFWNLLTAQVTEQYHSREGNFLFSGSFEKKQNVERVEDGFNPGVGIGRLWRFRRCLCLPWSINRSEYFRGNIFLQGLLAFTYLLYFFCAWHLISIQYNCLDHWSTFFREFASNRSVKKLNLAVWLFGNLPWYISDGF